MPRSTARSPNGGGLASQTGWIGSIARFWEVSLLFVLAAVTY